MSEPEKRRHVRIDFQRHVQLDFFTEVYDECQVRNIALGGMFVHGKFSCKVDDLCYLNFAQKGKRTYLTLEAAAKVVRREDEGIALEFTSMSFESLLSLEMILLYQERNQSSETAMKLPEDVPFEISEEASSIRDKYNPLVDETSQ